MKKSLSSALWLALPLAFLASGCSSSDTTDDFGSEEPMAAGETTFQVEESAAPAAQDPGADRGEMDLRMQKVQLLVADHLDAGRKAYADGRLMEAEASALAALELDAGSAEARVLLDDVQLAMGKVTGVVRGEGLDAAAQLRARLERARAETQAHADRGFELLGKGEFEEAINALRQAQANIRGTSYDIDWSGLDREVADALSAAEANRAVALANQREAERQQAFEDLQAAETAREAQATAERDLMLHQAITAWENRDYDESIALSEEVLRLDPLNDKAREVRDTAFRSRREHSNERWQAERSEKFRTWLEDLQESMIPQTEILRDPDLDYWGRISKARARFVDFGTTPAEEPENRALAAQIKQVQIPGLVVEGETSLEEVINALRTYVDLPFVVAPEAIEAVDAEGIEFNLNLRSKISVENALNVITEAAGSEVTYTFRYGVVYITTRTKAQGQFVLKAHDVQDLTSSLVDFSGPKIDKIHLPDDEPVDEDEMIQGGVTGEPVPIVDSANLETLVQASVAPETWEEVEGVSISYSNGHLIVWHTPAVQQEIHAFLEDLRRYISSMVTIEARFLTLQKDYLQEIGVDFRGLGGTFSPPTTMANLDDLTSGLEDNSSRGLDNSGSGLPGGAESSPSAGAYFSDGLDGDIRARNENILGGYGSRLSTNGGLAMQLVFLDDTQLSMILNAVEKSNRVQELNSSTVSAQNTQRAFITVLNQITYVQDMDVEVAQAALIADPQVGVVSDGIVLDVRPTISHDRRYITLELRPTVASLKRPIPEFTSSLAGLTTPVTLQLPELNVSSANTTAVIPDGGTVVIAGLKKTVDIEQRAEVPFLGEIPFLSFLFKAEGSATEQEDVIVIIRAQIIDALEKARQLDARL
jgi:tetratricopeptide (TPR) repeat protein